MTASVLARSDELPTSAEALDAIHEHLQPSIIVNTHGGYQPWWLFDEPLDLTSDRETAERRLKAFTGRLRVKNDSMDLTQILRCPGTRHNKYGTIVTVEGSLVDVPRYSLDEIDAILPDGCDVSNDFFDWDFFGPPTQYSLADQQKAMAMLDRITQYDDRDVWISVGHQLKEIFGEAGFQIWRTWSAQSDKWKDESEESHRARWNGIQLNPKGLAVAALVNLAGNDPELPIINLSGRFDEEAVTDDVIDAWAPRDCETMQYAESLVQVVEWSARDESEYIDRPAGAPVIRRMLPPSVRGRITKHVAFEKYDKRAKANRRTSIPGFAVSQVCARYQWEGIRQLTGLVPHPVFRKDGTLIHNHGFDDKTGLYLHFEGPVNVPDRPTREDAQAAATKLLDVVCDFPFANHRLDKSNWLAALITQVVRYAHAGPMPMILVEANLQGAGKTKLADLVSLILTGRTMARQTFSESEEEIRKRITAACLEGDSIVLLDNIKGRMDSPALETALTATVWTDRRLGVSESISLPCRISWFATVNRASISEDLIRRCCRIQLDSTEESPHLRTGFRYPDLESHVLENRDSLLAALLTVVRAWFAAGQPRVELKQQLGSYEAWGSIVRQILMWIGLPDPAECQKSLIDEKSDDRKDIERIVHLIEELDPGNNGVKAKILFELCSGFTENAEHLKELANEVFDEPRSVKVVGMRLSQLAGRYVSVSGQKVKLETKKTRTSKLWVLNKVCTN